MENLTSLCRFCLKSGAINPLESVLHFIKHFSNTIDIKENDELPQVVCAKCYLKLSEIDTFIHEIRTVQKQLQTVLLSKKSYRKKTELSSNSSNSSTRHLDLSNKLMRLDDDNLVYLECTKCNNLKFEDQETFDTHIMKFHQEPPLLPPVVVDADDHVETKCHESYKTSQNLKNPDDEIVAIKVEDEEDVMEPTVAATEIQEEDDFNFALVEDYGEIMTTEEFLEESSLQSFIMDDDEIFDNENNKFAGKTLFSCTKPECQKGFQTQFALILHLAEEHEEKTLSCNQCNSKFNSFEEYVFHKKVEIEETKLFNEIMNSEEKMEKNYEILEKNGSYKFICKLCRRQFNQKFNLEKHKCKYAELGVKKCLECNQEFSSNRELFKHRQSHLAENISCTLCDKKFKSYDGLKYHLKVHVFKGSKSIDCPYCDRKFIARVNLNAHMKQLHSNLKTYRCSYENCDKVFATFDHLRKHEIVHLNLRKYPCSFCNRSFFQLCHRREHERTQHKAEKDKELFPCALCPMVCSTKYVLKRHIFRKHRQEEQ